MQNLKAEDLMKELELSALKIRNIQDKLIENNLTAEEIIEDILRVKDYV